MTHTPSRRPVGSRSAVAFQLCAETPEVPAVVS
jgi:hypothetical protein